MKKMLCALLFAFCVSHLSAFAGEETVLRFSWWGGDERHAATLEAVRLFEQKNPGIKVNAEYMGWDGYLERLTTQIGAQSEPDLMQVDWAWISMFSKDGNGFYNIYDLKDRVNLGEFEQQWLDTGSVNGKLNALPVSFTALVVPYNRPVWQRAGVAYPKTWDELIAAGPAFKQKLGPDYYPMDLIMDEIIYFTHAYIFQKTGKQYIDPAKPEIALTREELIDWLGFYRSMVDSGAVTSVELRTAIGGNMQRQSQEFKEYVDGLWAGSCTYDSALANRLGTVNSADFDIGPFPTVENAKSSGRVGRPAMLFALSKNSKNAEAAAKLATFLLSDAEAVKILKSTRGIFVTKTGYDTLLAEGLISPLNKVAMDQIRATQCYTPNPYFEHARTKELMYRVFEEIGYGKTSVEDGADTLLREGARIIERLER